MVGVYTPLYELLQDSQCYQDYVRHLWLGDRGVRVKKPCWIYLKDLYEGEQRLFTECQN